MESSTPLLELLGQSSEVTPAAPTFFVNVRVGKGAPPGAQLSLTVYDAVQNRSDFEKTLAGSLTRELQPLPAVAVSGLAPLAGGGARYVAAVVTQSSTANQTGPVINLPYDSVTKGYAGVYPVVVALESATGSTLSKFTTYLTFAESSTDPLLVSVILPVRIPVRIHSRAKSPSDAVTLPAHSTVSTLSSYIDAIGASSGVPATIQAFPQTVQALEESGTTGRTAVASLAALSTASVSGQPVHELVSQPYVPIDLSALTAAGSTSEIQSQMAPGVLPTDIRTDPSTTWIANGMVSAAIGKGLTTVGASRLVLPELDLAPANQGNLTWSQPFDLSFPNGTFEAAAVDSELSSQFETGENDPVLAANQLLADLNVIHIVESPFPNANRGVIVEPPSSWVPNAQFTAALLQGLIKDQVVEPVTLDKFFAQVPEAQNGAPMTRKLLTDSGPQISAAIIAGIGQARLRVDEFASAVPGNVPIKGQLAQLLLASESSDLRPSGQRDGLAAFERLLNGQLSMVQVETKGTITITASKASIPITVTSSAPYTIIGIMTLSSGKLVFPQGSTHQMIINHATNSRPFEIQALTSGDLPLDLQLTAPSGIPPLVIAQGRLTIRSTATSVVGIALTGVAAVVLVAWWARTWRRGRRRRRLSEQT